MAASLGEPPCNINITQSGEKRGIAAIQVRDKDIDGILLNSEGQFERNV
jgi:hypothetical protein